MGQRNCPLVIGKCLACKGPAWIESDGFEQYALYLDVSAYSDEVRPFYKGDICKRCFDKWKESEQKTE